MKERNKEFSCAVVVGPSSSLFHASMYSVVEIVTEKTAACTIEHFPAICRPLPCC